jgi:hypothetical protein
VPKKATFVKSVCLVLAGLTAFVIVSGDGISRFAGRYEDSPAWGVREYTTVKKQLLVAIGVAAICQMGFPEGYFVGLGYFQGYTPGWVWYDNPQWFCDGAVGYDYDDYWFLRLGAAPLNTDHLYTITYHQASDTWRLYIDDQLKNTRYNIPYSWGVASCTSEAHSTSSYLTYHHWGNQKQTDSAVTWADFQSPQTFEDWPYDVLEISNTEFWTWNPEA